MSPTMPCMKIFGSLSAKLRLHKTTNNKDDEIVVSKMHQNIIDILLKNVKDETGRLYLSGLVTYMLVIEAFSDQLDETTGIESRNDPKRSIYEHYISISCSRQQRRRKHQWAAIKTQLATNVSHRRNLQTNAQRLLIFFRSLATTLGTTDEVKKCLIQWGMIRSHQWEQLSNLYILKLAGLQEYTEGTALAVKGIVTELCDTLVDILQTWIPSRKTNDVQVLYLTWTLEYAMELNGIYQKKTGTFLNPIQVYRQILAQKLPSQINLWTDNIRQRFGLPLGQCVDNERLKFTDNIQGSGITHRQATINRDIIPNPEEEETKCEAGEHETNLIITDNMDIRIAALTDEPTSTLSSPPSLSLIPSTVVENMCHTGKRKMTTEEKAIVGGERKKIRCTVEIISDSDGDHSRAGSPPAVLSEVTASQQGMLE